MIENSRIGCVALVLACGVACAEDVPGVAPTQGRLHFPLGMTQTDDGAYLVVASSNFDQRYNAGSLTAFSVERLAALVPAAGAEPVFVPDFGDAITGFAKVPPFSSDALYARGSVFVTSRGKNRVTRVDVDANGALSCVAAGEEAIKALDCSESYSVRTYFDDPYALVYAPGLGAEGTIAVGHLVPGGVAGAPFGRLTILDLATFSSRATRASGTEPLPTEDQAPAVNIFGLVGMSGPAFLPGPALGRPLGSFIATSGVVSDEQSREIEVATSPRLATFGVTESGTGFGVEIGSVIDLARVLDATETRGVVVDEVGGRVFASVRFDAIGDSQNGAIAVASVGDTALSLRPVMRLGEELQRPYLYRTPAGRTLLYVGDIRTDQIFVVDASSDVPVHVHTIEARVARMDGDQITLRRFFDAPTHMAFTTEFIRTIVFSSHGSVRASSR